MTNLELQAIGLPDGRTLAFTECGAPRGRPLVYFHGAPGSRLEGGSDSVFAGPLKDAGIRLLAIDRPGYGASTPHEGRRVVDHVPDVLALLDQLAIERAPLIGWSTGGPHALATAARHPERVTAVGVIAGIAPIQDVGLDGVAERPLLELAATDPQLLRAEVTRLAAAMREDPLTAIMKLLEGALNEDDLAFAAEPAATNIMIATLREAAQLDLAGYTDDLIALRKPWGFALTDVVVPVHIIHGRNDLLIPIAHGRHLASQLPIATITEVDAGHLSALRRFVDLATTITSTSVKSPS